MATASNISCLLLEGSLGGCISWRFLMEVTKGYPDSNGPGLSIMLGINPGFNSGSKSAGFG